MVKISNSFVLIAALRAAEDGDAMLQVVKQAPALAQTASAVRASRHQQAHQMESNFEKLAAEAVRTGETPSLGADVRTAVNSALQTLEDELKMEKDANDAEMDGAISQFAACNSKREKSFIDVDGMKLIMEQAKDKHAECRGTEDPNCGDEKTNCDDQDEYARDAHDAGPHCVCEAFGTAGTQKVCLDRAVKWGAEYNTALGKKITACDGAREVADEVAQVCDRDQVTFEMAVCSYKVELTATCEGHSACYEAAVSNRATVMVNVKLKEASEKIMWKSCQKVRCYLDMLDATEASSPVEFTKCQEQDADTTHLDIIYPDSPEMAVCETTPVITDPDWLEAEYAKLKPTKIWLPKRKGIENAAPCPQQTSLVLPTPPTEQTRLGENDGGIHVPQPEAPQPEAFVIAAENKYFYVPGNGAQWGGPCTCPDGQTYDVSDNDDNCGSLKCQGGKAGRCERKNKQSRTGKKAECAPR